MQQKLLTSVDSADQTRLTCSLILTVWLDESGVGVVVLLVSVSDTCRSVTVSSLSAFCADLMGVAHFLADRRDLRRKKLSPSLLLLTLYQLHEAVENMY